MSSQAFTIREHVIICQHFRQCRSTNISEEQSVRLCIKQYIPKDHPTPGAGDTTVIGAHGNAFVKELYEPLWEDIALQMKRRGKKLRSIWIADVSNQGASGLVNEESKYDDVSWYDHSRDLLHMINHFRTEMVQPVVAIGHSMGANQLAALSVAHPTLFTSLILIDPIFAPSPTKGMGLMLAKGVLRKRVEWPTRDAAEKTFKKAFATWDTRVLERWNKHALYTPEEKQHLPGPLTKLVTSRFSELLGFMSPAFIYNPETDSDEIPWAKDVLLGHKIVELIPRNTLYICGALSFSAGPEIREDWLARTGTGPYMGRRVAERRVETAVIPRAGHFAPLEDPEACAEAVVAWLMTELHVWDEGEKKMRLNWRNLRPGEKEERAEMWMASLKAKL